MKIAMLGVNHETASVDFREKMAMTEAGKIDFINRILELPVSEVVVLATCGRFELYYATPAEQVLETPIKTQLIHWLSRRFHMEDLAEHLYDHEQEACVRHLMRVAIGLDSAVLGEDQILGQVKEAQLFSMELGTSGKVLNKLFREAIATAKAIKTELKISEHPLSLSYIGIKKIKELSGGLSGKTVTMVGLGKMGQLALKSMIDESVGKIYASVRTPCKLDKALLDEPHLEVVSFDDRHRYIEMSDVVISATAAPHAVIRTDQLSQLKNNCVMLDLALPRDIEPEIAKKFGSTIIDVDGLKDISEENVLLRKQIADHADSLLDDPVDDFMKWLDVAHIDQVVRQWHEDIDLIHQDTMAYLKRRLKGVDSRSMGIIDKMVLSSMKRFIRKPLGALKSMEDGEVRRDAVKLLEELFSHVEEESDRR